MLNKKILNFTQSSPRIIVITITMAVLLGSIPTVYFLTSVFKQDYNAFVFYLSFILPLILTPPVIVVVLNTAKHVKYFREELDREIQKNKKRDIILFEQARFIIMGEMLANISHQWKQPLNTVGLAIVAARTSQKTPEEMEEYFDIMEDNIRYLASTIDDFMSFFDKKTHLERRSLDSIVKEIESVIYTNVKNKGINLEIRIDESYGEVKVASSISQVILNLINNAKDAIKPDSKNKDIKLLFITNENGLEIECCDSGIGIADDIKDKIFNPYFTTKTKSQGTGIGLHMSKEIVQKIFDGKINVSSRDISRSNIYPFDNSEKTCFFIALPYSKQCVLQKKDA
jgi:two-component system, NtrC family, C4-dicarboxylate transport sensor histidine kinase DctB